MVEAIKAARVAAHIVDLSRNISEAKFCDILITNKRVKSIVVLQMATIV